MTRRFDQYVYADVHALLTGQVPEGRALDYKRDLPGSADADRKEFLADVSSFANAGGGDLILGVDEVAGVPTEIKGVATEDADALIRQLDDIIRGGIQPRLRVQIRAIPTPMTTHVIWIRVEQSWDAPHRVIFKGSDKFFGRSAAGKHPLDVTELRHVFQRTGGVIQAVEQFRDDRIKSLQADRGAVALGRRPSVLVHLIPLESFARQVTFDVVRLPDWRRDLQPMSAIGWSDRITMNGVLSYALAGTMPVSFAQLYRSGIVEFADSASLGLPNSGSRSIPSTKFEERVIAAVTRGLAIQRRLGSQPPIYCFITLVDVAGMTLGVRDDSRLSTDQVPLSEDVLALPEAVFSDFDAVIAAALRPSLDVMWNAFDHERSPNFAPDGTWHPV